VGVTPETQYVKLGDLHLAYQVLGTGPRDILMFDQWFSHMDAQWDVLPLAGFRERLASFGRLIMFDKRGAGLSDPVPTMEHPTLEGWMDDAAAVLDAVGSEKAVLIANLGGGLLGTTFAAAHPDRVAGLVLVDCFARFVEADDYAIGYPPADVEAAVEEIESGAGHGMMLDLFAPSVVNDEPLRRAWARYERQAASPGMMKSVVRLIYESDIRGVLPAIRVPTLVIQRRDARRFGPPFGRHLADNIADAKYVELPGADSLIWAGDQDAMLAEIEDFVTGVRRAPEPNRVLATVLFTDIVGSTARAAELGDARWRRLLGEHNHVAGRLIERFGGRLIDTAGDGLFATFDGPARAVRCAMAIREGVAELGLEVRAGLHTGEIELLGSDVAGLAVHIGARVSALAEGGEVLVSSTVKDLVVGSGLTFEDRGLHGLKGVPGEWRIFLARDASAT
jgi:class 3 adenylate cyclase